MHCALPSRDKADAPYVRLWLGVLYQAITDARGEHPGTPGQRRLAQRAALRWFHDRSAKPGAFMWLCNHLLNRTAESVLTALRLTKEEVFPQISPIPLKSPRVRVARRARRARAASRAESAYQK